MKCSNPTCPYGELTRNDFWQRTRQKTLVCKHCQADRRTAKRHAEPPEQRVERLARRRAAYREERETDVCPVNCQKPKPVRLSGGTWVCRECANESDG